MANEYGTNMTYAPDWERACASKAVSAVFLGELSVDTPREAGTRAAAEYLDCPLVTIPGAHNGLRDRPVTAQTPFAMSWSVSTLDDLRGEGLLAFRHC